MIERQDRLPVGALIVGMGAVFALLLALPGRTITTSYVNDLFIFLDGAHRVVWGQVPNRDFHTALGPLVYYLPGAGYWLSGTLAGAMPVAMALAVVVLVPFTAHVLISRLEPLIALLLGAFLLLVVAVPMNLGEEIRSLSFAMFYNRVGWAALATLLVMYLRPRHARPYQGALDTVCAAFLILVMLYTKVTYGAVALAFLTFMLLDQRQWRWAAAAFGVVLLSGLAIELFWQASAAHLADLIMTARVSGSRGVASLVQGFLRHLADYVLFGTLAVLALWRTRSFRDVLFFGFCAGPGLLIVSQNSQPWGIITLHAGAAVAAELVVRSSGQRDPSEPARDALGAGAPVLLLAFLLPTALHCFMALLLHAGLAVADAGEEFGLPKFTGIKLAQLWSPGDRDLSVAYLESIRAGARALADLEAEPARVSVLDFANPFSAGLGLPPPRGDNSWLHWGRNIDAEHYLVPDQLLGGVDVLMEPAWGINHLPLKPLYAAYLGQAFEPVSKTDSWTVHVRRRAPAGPP
jgi:hypothetical protein